MTSAADTTPAAEFERHRAHLTGVACRMLGTLTDAEDAAQETYLRFARATDTDPRDVRAWLTTAVARICLDELGSARARREITSAHGCRNRWPTTPGASPSRRWTWVLRTG